MATNTITRPVWCEACATESREVYCAMIDDMECAECHMWLECPCAEDD